MSCSGKSTWYDPKRKLVASGFQDHLYRVSERARWCPSGSRLAERLSWGWSPSMLGPISMCPPERHSLELGSAAEKDLRNGSLNFAVWFGKIRQICPISLQKYQSWCGYDRIKIATFVRIWGTSDGFRQITRRNLNVHFLFAFCIWGWFI